MSLNACLKMFLSRSLRAAVLMVLCGGLAHAETTQVKGAADISYSKKLEPKQRADAMSKAKLNAVERFYAEQGATALKNYEIVRDDIAATLNDYVLSAAIVMEEDDEKAKTYRLVIRAELNSARLNNKVQGASATANTVSAERSYLSFIFVAREQESVQRFDEKIYKRRDLSHNEQASAQVHADAKSALSNNTVEGERIQKSQIATNDQVKVNAQLDAKATLDASSTRSDTITTGGSSTKKADEVKWRVTTSSELNNSISGVFSAANYEVIDAADIPGIDLTLVQKDFGSGNDLSPSTRQATVKSMQENTIPFLAMGTMDVALPDTDPQTGMQRVYVTVNGKVLDIKGKFPKTVSAVGPIQFAGIGPSADVARTNALKLAAEKAAGQMLNELNAKGVH